MKENTEVERQAVTSLVARIFALIMVVLYISLGTTIIIRSGHQTMVKPSYAVIFGSILILYGLFRAFKVYRTYYSTSGE